MTNRRKSTGRGSSARTPRSRPRDVSLPRLPKREREAHKGDFGRVLVIAGSVSMPGAALLATLGALRGGAGLVTLATVREIVPWIVAAAPSAMFLGLPSTRGGGIASAGLDDLLERAEASDVVAIGPGLGKDRETRSTVRALVMRSKKPMVLDADGLNAFEGDVATLARRSCPLVITPHGGEFARLTGEAAPTGELPRRARSLDLANRLRATVLLKGARTVITDGERVRINSTGNPGMATGGSGDVLTGLLAALLARSAPFDAAAIAAHVHGLAGDLAASEGCQTSLIATDLIATLPRAFKTLEPR